MHRNTQMSSTLAVLQPLSTQVMLTFATSVRNARRRHQSPHDCICSNGDHMLGPTDIAEKEPLRVPGRSGDIAGQCRRIRFTFLASILLGIGTQVWAQVPTQAQIDFNTARTDATLGTSTTAANMPTFGSVVSFGILPISGTVAQFKAVPLPVNPFTFNFLAPINYVSDFSATGGAQRAAEATPELKQGFVVHPDNVVLQFSGFLDESSDRYTGSIPNTDKLSGSLRVDWVGTEPFPDRQRLIPYLSYSPQQVYAAFFGKSKPFTQDLALGVNKLWDFSPKWSLYDGRAGVFPTWELGLQIATQHRVVNSGPDSDALLIGPSLKWARSNAVEWPHCVPEVCGMLSASVSVNLTRRWYDRFEGISSSSWTAAPIFTFAWGIPDRFLAGNASNFGSPELDFQLAYNDLSIDTPGQSSHQWSVGLIVKTGLTF
jgi:hypothetical protein